MRIALLGYAEPHSIKWANVLSERNHTVYLIIPRTNDSTSLSSIGKRVQVIQMPFNGKLGYYLNAHWLRKICNRINPDVLNVHSASGNGTLARIARIKNVFLSVWGSDVYLFPYQSRISYSIIRKNLLHASVIGSTSNCMKRQIEELIGNNKEIIVTPFGVDIDLFSYNGFCHKDDDEIVIGVIKSLEPVYGIPDLVKAIKILLTSVDQSIGCRIKCVIYGDGSQKEQIQSLIREMKLEEKITLMGRIKNVDAPNALSGIDIFCVTSLSESFGVVAVEAQAMNIPIVATDAEGYVEVVEDGVTGIIVKRGNPQSIADGLKELVLHKELRDNMGKKGRERVLKLYDLKRVNVKQMEEGYSKVIENV